MNLKLNSSIMKRLLLSALVVFIGSLFFTVYGQELTLKIIETHKDGETSVSFDDGEYENDSIDKLDDDDLDMGWEGDDLNIMTSFTRFQNVTIPQGETIVSAILTVYAHEDEEDEAIITVYGEAVDNSEAFAEDEALADRTFTTAFVDWTCSDSWTMWESYSSPDLKSIIQEIVDRPGWASGNALTLFMQGEDQGASLLDNARDFESFENIEDPDDGGDGLHHPERIPTLVITYGEVSSINAQDTDQAANIYPNPVANGAITIDLPASVSSVRIFDVTGKLVFEESSVLHSITINTTDLTTGLYQVEVAKENILHYETLIVK